MKMISKIYCEAYERMVDIIKCRNCSIKKDLDIKNGEKCPYNGKFLLHVVEMKGHELIRLKKFTQKNGNYPVNCYIREAVIEYLDDHEE